MALQGVPRIPIFIQSIDREEPTELSGYMKFAFDGIKVGDAARWAVTVLPPVQWAPEGITVQSLRNIDTTETPASNVAVAICEILRSEDLVATVLRVPSFAAAAEWPIDASPDAVVIKIAAKPNHFWQNKKFREQGLPEIIVPSGCTPEEILRQFPINQPLGR
jgi:hypothetical protein